MTRRDEVISSGGTNTNANVNTPVAAAAASSAGASSALPTNFSADVSKISAPHAADSSSQPSCRPWDRGDLLRRLATFKPAYWFTKPKAATSLACARKGWTNIGVDEIDCQTCGANLKYADAAPAGSISSGADGTAEEFPDQLDLGHKAMCPWRGNSCPESLVQFPPTPPSGLIGGFKDRCDGLLQFAALPVVAASAIDQMRNSHAPQIDRFLANSANILVGDLNMKPENTTAVEFSRDGSFTVYSSAQKLIALCGWEARWFVDIQDCEDNSAQSARNGYSVGHSKGSGRPNDTGTSKKAFSTTAKKDSFKNEVMGPESKCESRSPLLDCSLCGATVRIWDFLTVSCPARVAMNGVEIPETSKKLALTRGASAASGISGWVGTNCMEKEQTEYHDEAATTDEGKLAAVDLNLTMAGGFQSSNCNVPEVQQQLDFGLGKDLMIGQPSTSEFGGRATSYESRGPSTRKRSLEEGGSTVDRPVLRTQQADSVEGSVIDRDGDEVDDSKQYSAGPSKRAREFDIFERCGSSFRRDSSGAGPSNSQGVDFDADERRIDLLHGNDQAIRFPATRDSTHASSVIAMDTIGHNADDDSMESVENFPTDVDDISFPSMAMPQNPDGIDTSEHNCSNQAQQSVCFQPAAALTGGEMGVSSTVDGDEVLNTDTVTAHARDGPSIGISVGSVGMDASHEAEIHGADIFANRSDSGGASHEAEIHGADIFANRSDSGVGDVDPVAEVVENQGQTGEFAPERGSGDDLVAEMDREDPHGDSQDVVSRSMGRADSGSKVVCSTKAESVESGEKNSDMQVLAPETSAHPSLSCNAIVYSGIEASKEEVSQGNKQSPVDDCAYPESGYVMTNGIGPPNGGSNFDDVEFDPIKHHNSFCPWVNGNVAAAGCITAAASTSSAGAVALCGWQLTLDALDTFQSVGHIPVQAVESESAASLYKDDQLTSSGRLLARHSFSRSRG